MDYTASWFSNFRRRITAWYKANARDLPWRKTHDPYRIWISEVMLQQTQVATVIDYYERFLQQFPDVHALASAHVEQVLHLWSGLGYYRRARSLHHAAQSIVQKFSGNFPTHSHQLRELNGIGRYTAGAIASFTFDRREPILEANTIRLFSRIMAIQQPVQSSQVQTQLWNFAEAILPTRSGTRLLNQAVMELGSQVCKPAEPDCAACPIRSQCRSHSMGLEKQIPVVKRKPPIEHLMHVGVIIMNHRKQVLLRQNPPGQWWAGLWDLPWIALHGTVIKSLGVEKTRTGLAKQIESPEIVKLICNQVSEELGLDCRLGTLANQVVHAVTKYKIRYLCVNAQLLTQPSQNVTGLGWFRLNHLPPMVSRFRRLWLGASQLR